jgi:hypothetical protein
VVGKFLELHEVNFPGARLLLAYRFQGHCRVAMTPSGIVKKYMNPSLGRHNRSVTRIFVFLKSTGNAMWITLEVICHQ